MGGGVDAVGTTRDHEATTFGEVRPQLGGRALTVCGGGSGTDHGDRGAGAGTVRDQVVTGTHLTGPDHTIRVRSRCARTVLAPGARVVG